MSEAVIEDEKPATRRRTQARAVVTRQRILQAAAREFAERGFEGASTRNIAAAASLKHPLVTYHFKTKEGLWRAVLADLNERFRDRFDRRLTGLRGVDEVTILRLMLEEFIRFCHEHPENHWLMSDAARERNHRLEWLSQEYTRPTLQRMLQLIAVAQEQGRFIPGDPAHLLYLFIGAVTRIYMVSAEVKMVTGRSTRDAGFLERHTEACISLFFRDPAGGAAR